MHRNMFLAWQRAPRSEKVELLVVLHLYVVEHVVFVLIPVFVGNVVGHAC